jgi:acyl carrier protein
VAWGLWKGVGMAARDAGEGATAWAARGLGSIDPALGFAALERLLAQNACHALVLPIDWPRFLGSLPAGMDRGFFARVGRLTAPATTATGAMGEATATSGAGSPGIKSLRAQPPSLRRAALLALLREWTLAVIGLDPASPVDPRRPLKDLGLDSLMAVELRNVLIKEGGSRQPATLLFDYPSLDALTDHLMTVWELAVPAAARAAGSRPLDAVTAMSEAEAEALLLAELSAGGGK